MIDDPSAPGQVITGVSPDLPHTGHLPAPTEWSTRLVKPLVAAVVRRYWRVSVHGARHVPASGPVILAANHIALLDGPVVVAFTPRLTFAMAKRELFVGATGRVLAQLGQISLDRHAVDTRAISRAVQVLRAGKALAVFPEGVRTGGELHWARGGAVYLAMISGAPIVPVAVIGTREPGADRDALPRRGGSIHVVYGPPITIPQRDWPRRKAEVREWTERLRQVLAAHVADAQQLTGMALPGPPPPPRPKAPKVRWWEEGGRVRSLLRRCNPKRRLGRDG